MKRSFNFLPFLLFLSLLSSVCCSGFARQPQKGYRGFLEWNASLRNEEMATFTGDGWETTLARETFFFNGASTSHGYQIDSRFFVGAGLGVERCPKWDTWIVPIFAQGRMDMQFGKFTPYADVRLGWNLSSGGGVYFSPTIGYRFNWGRKIGVNVGCGLSLIDYKIEKYEGVIDIDNGFYEIYYTDTYHKVKPYFSLRVGIDF